jgi:hypothetical protein
MLLALESVVRLLGLTPTLVPKYVTYMGDAHLPFKLKPLTSLRWANSEFTNEYAINSAGLRDAERPLAKPEGTFRILGLGDSFTFGVGAEFHDTYLFRLEKMIHERPGKLPNVEVVKAGITRFFPAAERLYLEQYGLAYEPDLVLVGFVPNDIVDTHIGLHGIRVTPSGHIYNSLGLGSFGDAASWLVLHSHVFRMVWPRIVALVQSGRLSATEELEARKQIEVEFSRIREAAARAGARMALIHIPERGPMDERARNLVSWLSDWSASNAVPFIDTAPAMEAASRDRKLYWERDSHCTPAGYEIIAEQVFSRLVEHRLLPQSPQPDTRR